MNSLKEKKNLCCIPGIFYSFYLFFFSLSFRPSRTLTKEKRANVFLFCVYVE